MNIFKWCCKKRFPVKILAKQACPTSRILPASHILNHTTSAASVVVVLCYILSTFKLFVQLLCLSSVYNEK